MGIVRFSSHSNAKYIGSELALTSNWQITQNINVLGGYAHLFAGDFIRESGPALGSDYFSFYGYFVF